MADGRSGGSSQLPKVFGDFYELKRGAIEYRAVGSKDRAPVIARNNPPR